MDEICFHVLPPCFRLFTAAKSGFRRKQIGAPLPKITKRIIDALVTAPAIQTETLVWDSELRGFGVRKMPSGVASFFVFYRTKEGRQRKLVIGRVGTVTPDEARILAREKLAEVSKGGDPSANRHKTRQSITIAELCDLYLAKAEGHVKSSTLTMDKSRIERHVKPLIGRQSVLSLTHEDVEKLHTDIIAGRTATARKGRGGVTAGGEGVASRTVGMLGTILQFAIKRKIIKENVARGIERNPDGRQERFLTVAEMAKLGTAMEEARLEGESSTALDAIAFLLMSGCRRMEALTLPMRWVDDAAGCIRFPDTKTGPQNRVVGASAISVLKEANHRNGWAFPGARGTSHFVGLPKVLRRLCDRAGLKEVTVHVLRHSFASTAAELGFSVPTIAGLLGHKLQGVTNRYVHVPDAALVLAANTVSAKIASALYKSDLASTKDEPKQ